MIPNQEEIYFQFLILPDKPENLLEKYCNIQEQNQLPIALHILLH
jgi:hypothetical protein